MADPVTPGPLFISKPLDNQYSMRRVRAISRDSKVLAHVNLAYDESQFVITACEMHDDLVGALKALHRIYNDRKGISYELDHRVRTVLAKAGAL